MDSLIEYLILYSVKIFGFIVRVLPINFALFIGRVIGLIAYCFDIKHKSIAYANLKIAFAETKSTREIKRILRQLFQNYGMNLIELLRLPLMTPERFDKYIKIEGKEHVTEALGGGKGVVLHAMHYGSWEMASLASGMMGAPYKVVVKPQKRFSKLDDLLNEYRSSNGSVVVERGFGTRKFIEGLRNNEIVGLVVDQGGKGGTLMPFFGRHSSMSVGAIRMGLKLGVPVCFAIIIRQKGPYHKFIIHKPFHLENTGDIEQDVKNNLSKVIEILEKYIKESPSEYMWFYKIWKYAKESSTLILNDGKTGHLRQSEAIASIIKKALAEREISSEIKTVNIEFKNNLAKNAVHLLSVFTNNYLFQGKLGILKWFLKKDSFEKIISTRTDFVVSCGSSTAGLNYLLSSDYQAKSVVVLKPGIHSMNRFDLVVLPQHDKKKSYEAKNNVIFTKGAPNLIDAKYAAVQSELLLKRFSHLKKGNNFKIGFLLGGDTKGYYFDERNIKMVIHQIKEVAEELNAHILITTSRRTPASIENMLSREFKRYEKCPLLIIANKNNPEGAVGGIIGLSDVVLVSGDSVSMISEAASSGKKTVVFPAQRKISASGKVHKHVRFIDMLNEQGYILSSDVRTIRQSIYGLAKNKIQTRTIDDDKTILDAVRKII